MAKDTTKTTDVAGLLASTDLDELDKQIAERREAIKKIDGEIYSLELVRRSVEAFKNGRPERKAWSRKSKKTAAAPSEPEADSPAPPPRPDSGRPSGAQQDGVSPVVRIKRYLDQIGAAGIPAIARETGLTPAIVASTLQERSDAFVCKPGNIWRPK